MGGRGQQRPGSEHGVNQVGEKEQRESPRFAFPNFHLEFEGRGAPQTSPPQSLRASCGQVRG